MGETIIIIILCGLAAFYLGINFPFRNLICHQDAGWHAYWASFRSKGVTLRFQLNTLMGCTRLGVQFLHVLYRALGGKTDPEKSSRWFFWAVNLGTAYLLFHVICVIFSGDPSTGLAVAGVYILATSNPFSGIHYDTAERTAYPLNGGILALVAVYLGEPSHLLLGVVVFLMIFGALIFKLTQLAEYFFLWLYLAVFQLDAPDIGVSFIGGVAAISVFLGLVLWLGILRRENFGLLGYLSTSHGRANSRASAAEFIEKAQRRIDLDIRSPLIRKIGTYLLSGGSTGRTTPRHRWWFPVTAYLYLTAQRIRVHMGMLVRSYRALFALAVVGAVAPTQLPDLGHILLFWLAGGCVALVAQARYLPFHFLPLLMPLSILAGLGLHAAIIGAVGGYAWAIGSLACVVLLAGLDVTYSLKRLCSSDHMPLDYRVWPESFRAIMDKNFAAYEVARFLRDNTDPDDHVLVWGCVPQVHALSGCRSSINWLTTKAWMMDPILPDWRHKMYEQLRQDPPRYIFQFDDDLNSDMLISIFGPDFDLADRSTLGNVTVFHVG